MHVCGRLADFSGKNLCVRCARNIMRNLNKAYFTNFLPSLMYMPL